MSDGLFKRLDIKILIVSLFFLPVVGCGDESSGMPDRQGLSSPDTSPVPAASSAPSPFTPADPASTVPDPVSTPSPSQATSRVIRILPLGDSITQGGDGYPSYRRSLWMMLSGFKVDFIGSHNSFNGSSPYTDFDLDNEGHWAWEAGELDNSLNSWLDGYTPDIVLLHAGTNDVDRGQSNSSTTAELESIIDKLRAKNSAVIILMAKLIPMRHRDTTDINQDIEVLAAEKSTAVSPVVIVDQYTGYNPATDNHDNYHPNTQGEEKMARQWFAALQAFLP